VVQFPTVAEVSVSSPDVRGLITMTANAAPAAASGVGPGRARQTAIFRAGALEQAPSIPTDASTLERRAKKVMSATAWAYVAGAAGEGRRPGAGRRRVAGGCEQRRDHCAGRRSNWDAVRDLEPGMQSDGGDRGGDGLDAVLVSAVLVNRRSPGRFHDQASGELRCPARSLSRSTPPSWAGVHRT
jgi:hypothetical protein